jgi:hypothetical protein
VTARAIPEDSQPNVPPRDTASLRGALLCFPGGHVDTSRLVSSHAGPTPSTQLTHDQLLVMARDALDRIHSDDSGDPKRTARFALECLRDALERWP